LDHLEKISALNMSFFHKERFFHFNPKDPVSNITGSFVVVQTRQQELTSIEFRKSRPKRYFEI
jgi:hypothetical protein